MNTVRSCANCGDTASPSNPPSPWALTPGTVWTSDTTPLRSDLIFAVLRSVNTALPSGRKPSPHGTASWDATTEVAACAGAAETASAQIAAAAMTTPFLNLIGAVLL